MEPGCAGIAAGLFAFSARIRFDGKGGAEGRGRQIMGRAWLERPRECGGLGQAVGRGRGAGAFARVGIWSREKRGRTPGVMSQLTAGSRTRRSPWWASNSASALRGRVALEGVCPKGNPRRVGLRRGSSRSRKTSSAVTGGWLVVLGLGPAPSLQRPMAMPASCWSKPAWSNWVSMRSIR